MAVTDSLFTPVDQQVGIHQPRPEATLHVGGTLIADGLASFKAGATVIGTFTTGNLTVTGTATITTLTVTGAASVGSNLTVTGNVTAANLTASNTVQGLYISAGTSGMFSAGRVSIAAGDSTGVATANSSSGSFEVGNNAGGAAKISFHRHGAYATYLGLDTDNVFAVGGWSMGAVRYVLHHSGNRPGYSVAVAGSTLVQRTPEGYIQTNYLNMTADIQGGKPAYIVGMNATDYYLRWWPASAIGPPANPILISQAWDLTTGDGNTLVQVALFQPDRVGNWYIMMRGNGRNPQNEVQNDYFIDIDGVGRAATGMLDGEGGGAAVGTTGLFNGPYVIGPGNWIRTYCYRRWGYMNGTSYALFVPTQQYPG
jgi:hypothetical protein